MAKKPASAIIKRWTSIKKEVKGLAKSKKPVQDAQKILKKFVTQAEKDIKSAVEKDIPKLVTRFKKEKKDLEKSVEKVIKTEIKKAKSFIKELEKVNVQVKVTLPDFKKKKKKKVTKKKATKKKVTKKKTTVRKKTKARSTKKKS